MSNLNVTYTTQIAPGIAPAAGVTATAGAPAADNPLGFLAALVDQLLTGSADAARPQAGTQAGARITVPAVLDFGIDTGSGTGTAPQPADLVAALAAQLDRLQAQLGNGETPAPADIDGLEQTIAALGASIGSTAPASTTPGPAPATGTNLAPPSTPLLSDRQISQLLLELGLIEVPSTPPATPATTPAPVEPTTDVLALRDRLLALSQSVAPTAPDLSRKLEALATQLVQLEPGIRSAGLGSPDAAPQPDPEAATIAQIIRTLLGKTDTAPASDASASGPSAQSAVSAQQDDMLQILATLGLATQPAAPSSTPASAPVEGAAAAAVTASVPSPLLRLSNQLTQVSTALADRHPDLAQKLEAVATRIVSTGAGADLLGQLTSAANAGRDGAALDRLVQSLIDNKPVTTPPPAAAPQIAAAAKLDIPAPIAPRQTKSAVTEVKAAQPEPAPVTADSAPPSPRVTLAAVHAGDTRADNSPRPDAKTTAVVADASKPDAAPPSANPSPANPAAPAAQQARPLPAAYQPVANPINMGQVAFEMVRQVHQGTSRFTIRLDPPELGRVDVKMHVDPGGTVNARLTVDRPETLDLFQRDQRSLERALAQAGLDSSKTNLEFSLRQNHQNPFAGMMGGDQHRQSDPGMTPRFSLGDTEERTPMPAVTLYRGLASAGGVNIFV